VKGLDLCEAYVRLREEFVYPAVLMDVFTRRAGAGS
jgi:hypothetical protein